MCYHRLKRSMTDENKAWCELLSQVEMSIRWVRCNICGEIINREVVPPWRVPGGVKMTAPFAVIFEGTRGAMFQEDNSFRKIMLFMYYNAPTHSEK